MNFIGVDLGGTNIKAGVVDEDANLLARVSIETQADRGPEHVLERMAQAADEARKKAGLKWPDIAAVGVGSPGPMDGKTGIVLECPNLPGWRNVPVVDKMQQKLGVTVYLENDANAAGFGEYWKGAGQGATCMIQLTLGTGVGGGIVINGQVWRGIDDCAAELGHMVIKYDGVRCGCGSHGCIEAYGSATALVRIAREKLDAGRPSILHDWVKSGQKLTAKLVADAAHQGDALAREIYREVGTYLGVAIASFCNIFNPEKVVLSGGMSQAGDILFGPIREEVNRRAVAPAARRVQILPASLGDDAGIIGAAGCAMQRYKEGRRV